jgi:hypothetical protein
MASAISRSPQIMTGSRPEVNLLFNRGHTQQTMATAQQQDHHIMVEVEQQQQQ